MVNKRTYWDSFDCERQCEEYIDEAAEEALRFGEKAEAPNKGYFTIKTALQSETFAYSTKGEQR